MTEYLRAHVVRDEAELEDSGLSIADGPLRIIAATAGRKADGLNLAMERADLERFTSNPVVMYGHDYFGRDNLPIGRAEAAWIEGDQLLMDVTFDEDDSFAAKVARKYRAGMMNTFSIGFDAYDLDDEGVPARWDLHEVSAVPIPLDPSAVALRDHAVRNLADDADAVAFARELVERAGAEPTEPSPAEADQRAAHAHRRRRLSLAEHAL